MTFSIANFFFRNFLRTTSVGEKRTNNPLCFNSTEGITALNDPSVALLLNFDYLLQLDSISLVNSILVR